MWWNWPKKKKKTKRFTKLRFFNQKIYRRLPFRFNHTILLLMVHLHWAKAKFLFEICHRSVWTTNWSSWEPIKKRRRFRIFAFIQCKRTTTTKIKYLINVHPKDKYSTVFHKQNARMPILMKSATLKLFLVHTLTSNFTFSNSIKKETANIWEYKVGMNTIIVSLWEPRVQISNCTHSIVGYNDEVWYVRIMYLLHWKTNVGAFITEFSTNP